MKYIIKNRWMKGMEIGISNIYFAIVMNKISHLQPMCTESITKHISKHKLMDLFRNYDVLVLLNIAINPGPRVT